MIPGINVQVCTFCLFSLFSKKTVLVLWLESFSAQDLGRPLGMVWTSLNRDTSVIFKVIFKLLASRGGSRTQNCPEHLTRVLSFNLMVVYYCCHFKNEETRGGRGWVASWSHECGNGEVAGLLGLSLTCNFVLPFVSALSLPGVHPKYWCALCACGVFFAKDCHFIWILFFLVTCKSLLTDFILKISPLTFPHIGILKLFIKK